MRRPFISSLGRSTTETVASATKSVEHRSTATARISLAFCSAVSFASSSIRLASAAASRRASSSRAFRSAPLASSVVLPPPPPPAPPGSRELVPLVPGLPLQLGPRLEHPVPDLQLCLPALALRLLLGLPEDPG